MRVSIERVEEFLLLNELTDERRVASDNEVAVKMDKFTYKWKEDDDFGIKNASLRVDKGDFAAIVGPVGCGKVKFFA